DRRVLQMNAGRTRLHQRRRRLVDLVREGKVVEVRLARPGSRAGKADGVAHTPRPAEDFDLVLVLRVDRLALDVAELREDVCCHGPPPARTATGPGFMPSTASQGCGSPSSSDSYTGRAPRQAGRATRRR